MAELVERYRMDTSHLLQAEADIHALPQSLLTGLAGSQPLDDVVQRLTRGELFYCQSHPQQPYCVFFRGKHYLNPAAQQVATPQAISQLRSRFSFIQIEEHAPPAEIRHGALIRQYYSSQRPIEPPKPLPELTHIESEPPPQRWLKLLFYRYDIEGNIQPVANLPYQLFKGSFYSSPFMEGKTPENGGLTWQGESSENEYHIAYGEPDHGTHTLAFLTRKPLDTEERIEIKGVGQMLFDLRYDDPWQTPITGVNIHLEDEQGPITETSASLGLNDLGRQDSEYSHAMRSLVGKTQAPYHAYTPVNASTIIDSSAADTISTLTQQILDSTQTFQTTMGEQIEPWLTQWNEQGLLSIPEAYRTGAHRGLSEWWQGEADFWGNVVEGLSSAAQYAQQQAVALIEWYDALPWQEKLNPLGAYILDVAHGLLDDAQDLWQRRDQLMALAKAFISGSVATIETALETLRDFPGEIGEIAKLLIDHSVEWTQGLIELVRQTPVLETIAKTVFGVVMMMPPNLWAEAIGTLKGYLLPEIIIGLTCAIIATLSAGAGSGLLVARLLSFTKKVQNLLKNAGKIGPLLQRVFDFIHGLTTMVSDLIRALRAHRLETKQGRVGETTEIVRKSEKEVP